MVFSKSKSSSFVFPVRSDHDDDRVVPRGSERFTDTLSFTRFSIAFLIRQLVIVSSHDFLAVPGRRQWLSS